MILAGECGTFNPLLLECLQDIQGNIQVEMNKVDNGLVILQNSFSVKNRHNTAPARARGGHILRFFPAEAPHARRAGRVV